MHDVSHACACALPHAALCMKSLACKAGLVCAQHVREPHGCIARQLVLATVLHVVAEAAEREATPYLAQFPQNFN
jgi:hypothetical protein